MVGRQPLQCKDLDAQFEVLVDVLFDKATSSTRGRALLGFWKWAARNDIPPSPLLECHVYSHCKWRRQENLAPHKAYQADRGNKVAKFVLGWKVEEGLISSRRASGVALAKC